MLLSDVLCKDTLSLRWSLLILSGLVTSTVKCNIRISVTCKQLFDLQNLVGPTIVWQKFFLNLNSMQIMLCVSHLTPYLNSLPYSRFKLLQFISFFFSFFYWIYWTLFTSIIELVEFWIFERIIFFANKFAGKFN